jgi:hypothetical protein
LQQRYSEEHPDVRRTRAELAWAREVEKAEAGQPKAAAPVSKPTQPAAAPDDSAAITTMELVRAERTAQLKPASMLDREAQTRSGEGEKILRT